MIPFDRIFFSCEQFVWGKILRDGKDISGYKIVGHSSGLLLDECDYILSKIGAGVPKSMIRGKSAHAFFNLPATNQVVFSRTQRSPKAENNSRYFFQTHFLITNWEALDKIRNDLVFLAEQIGVIEIFDEKKIMSPFQTQYLVDKPLENDLQAIIQKYPIEFLENVYRTIKGETPVAIFDTSENEQNWLEIFRLLLFLTHPGERQYLTFGMEDKYKLNPTGILSTPHIVIRLADAKVVPPHLVEKLPAYGLHRFREKLKEYGAVRTEQ
jgi:hypothetical protein